MHGVECVPSMSPAPIRLNLRTLSIRPAGSELRIWGSRGRIHDAGHRMHGRVRKRRGTDRARIYVGVFWSALIPYTDVRVRPMC